MDLSNIAVTKGHAPASYNIGVYYSASLDLAQHLSVAMVLNCGVAQATATVALELQESDDDSTYADITGATSGALTTAAGTYSKATVVIVVNLLSGSRKRYVRVVALPSAHAVDVDVAGMVALTEGDASVPTATTYLRVNV